MSLLAIPGAAIWCAQCAHDVYKTLESLADAVDHGDMLPFEVAQVEEWLTHHKTRGRTSHASRQSRLLDLCTRWRTRRRFTLVMCRIRSPDSPPRPISRRRSRSS